MPGFTTLRRSRSATAPSFVSACEEIA